MSRRSCVGQPSSEKRQGVRERRVGARGTCARCRAGRPARGAQTPGEDHGSAGGAQRKACACVQRVDATYMLQRYFNAGKNYIYKCCYTSHAAPRRPPAAAPRGVRCSVLPTPGPAERGHSRDRTTTVRSRSPLATTRRLASPGTEHRSKRRLVSARSAFTSSGNCRARCVCVRGVCVCPPRPWRGTAPPPPLTALGYPYLSCRSHSRARRL